MKEIWKLWREGYNWKTGNNLIRYREPIYISNFGNIKGRKACKINSGYLSIYYKGKLYSLHRLVAELFIPNPENKPFIDHIDTNKTNNAVWNLKWCSQKENCNNPITKENMKKHRENKIFKSVRCIETGIQYKSCAEASRALGIQNKCAIANAANPNDKFHKAVNGLHFQYI